MSDLSDLLRGTADLIDAVRDAYREQRTGFSEREAGDYLDTAGLDELADRQVAEVPQVSHGDLAAHITATRNAYVKHGGVGHLHLSEAIASSLLDDFRITKK